MTIRILLTGNCHVQYIAAALTHFGLGEVRTVGKLFDGPIHFRRSTSQFIKMDSAETWLTEPHVERGIIISQTTPLSRYMVTEKMVDRHETLSLLKIPFIKFDSVLRQASGGNLFGENAIRADQMFNELSLLKAGLERDHLEKISKLLRENPYVYTPNHFSGPIFDVLLEISGIYKMLNAAFGSPKVAQLSSAMRQDPGISHIHSGMPLDAVVESMGFEWLENDLKTRAAKQISMPYLTFKAQQFYPTHISETECHYFWRSLRHHYAAKNCRQSLMKCLHLYGSGREYRHWATQLAQHFIDLGKPSFAAIIIARRMRFDDARGKLLTWCMENISEFQRSPTACNVFKKASKHRNAGNARVVYEILRALES